MVPLGALIVLLLSQRSERRPDHALRHRARHRSTSTPRRCSSRSARSSSSSSGAPPLAGGGRPGPRVPLLATPFTIAQRATLLQLAATLLVIGWAMTQPEWRDRIHVARLRARQGRAGGRRRCHAVVAGVPPPRSPSRCPSPATTRRRSRSDNQQQSAQARRDSFAVGIDEWTERLAVRLRARPLLSHRPDRSGRPCSSRRRSTTSRSTCWSGLGLVGFVLSLAAARSRRCAMGSGSGGATPTAPSPRSRSPASRCSSGS